MALDFSDPEILAEEIARAEHLTRAHVEVTDELIMGYHSKFYRKDRQPEVDQTENHAYEFVALMLPLLAYDNPAVQIEARRVTVDEQIALGSEEALNDWIIEHDLQTLFELAAVDFLFGYGVLLTTFDSYGESDDPETPPLMAPCVHYVAPRRFILDPNAIAPIIDGDGYDGIRWIGHECVKDRDELEKLDGIDKDALDQLVEDVDIRELKRPTNEESPTRHEILYYEIWVPPEYADPKATTNGMIYTVAKHQAVKGEKGKAVYLRKPRPFFGPPWGPYALFGAYPVSGQAHPLAPIPAVHTQSEELNAHANAASRAAGREKSLVLVNGTNNALKKAMKDGKDGEVWTVPGLQPNATQQIEIGGVSAERYQYIQTLRERLDRNSGVNDARRGNIVQNTLATAIDTANQANSARDAFLQKKFARGVTQVLKTALWYFFNSSNVVRPLSPAAAKRLGMKHPVFHGGPQPGQDGQSFADLGLSIAPYSMERPNETELRQITLQLVNWLTGMAPNMPQLMWIDFKEMLEMVAKVFNQRGLTRIFLPDRLDQLRQMVAQQSQQQGPAQKPPKSPVETLNYRDAPPDIQRQIEAQAGLQPSHDGMTNDQQLQLIGHQNAANQQLRGAAADLAKHRHGAMAREAQSARLAAVQQQPAAVGAAQQ